MVTFCCSNGLPVIDIEVMGEDKPVLFTMSTLTISDGLTTLRQVYVPHAGLNAFCTVLQNSSQDQDDLALDRGRVFRAWCLAGRPDVWNTLGPAPGVIGWNL